MILQGTSVCACDAFASNIKKLDNLIGQDRERTLPPPKYKLSKNELYKMQNFEQYHDGDLLLQPHEMKLMRSILIKINKVQHIVGHGYFNLVSFDEMVAHNKNDNRVKNFTKEEFDFMEEIYFRDAMVYGFHGGKVISKITHRIPRREVKKISGSGHYLYRDYSLGLYESIKKDIGGKLYLTSGVRNVVKQLYLFLGKALSVDGNLSQASRSLAPPGYSFHATGDFDVGSMGLGAENFTDRFSKTREFEKLVKLGYVDFRYFDRNPFGVRFEPWHINGKRQTF